MKESLIVALDLDSLEEARRFVRLLKKEVTLYKVGSPLFTAAGPAAVQMIRDEGGEVFLDLKFHDIPNTVAKACEAAARLGVFLLNVHASGGREMLKAALDAVRATHRSTLLVGVTVLTSEEVEKETSSNVIRLATVCQETGLDGVVCSPQEIEIVRKECGRQFLIVTPGIRPVGSPQGDQRRSATPLEAIQKGADYIVVGRPILSASNPLMAVQSILGSLVP